MHELRSTISTELQRKFGHVDRQKSSIAKLGGTELTSYSYGELLVELGVSKSELDRLIDIGTVQGIVVSIGTGIRVVYMHPKINLLVGSYERND